MALEESAIAALLDALRAGGDLDIIREGLAVVMNRCMGETHRELGLGPGP
jgi:hypothetical protein